MRRGSSSSDSNVGNRAAGADEAKDGRRSPLRGARGAAAAAGDGRRERGDRDRERSPRERFRERERDRGEREPERSPIRSKRDKVRGYTKSGRRIKGRGTLVSFL
jgi:hypothetical protein